MFLPGRASALVLALCCAACAHAQTTPLWSGFHDHPHGYLSAGAAPDASAFLPPPPAPGSLEDQADVAVYRASRALAGSARWDQARSDNEIETPRAPRAFDEALGIHFDPEQAPALTLLLGRMLGDLETIQTPAKDVYSRPRPFVAEPGTTCIAPPPVLAASGSYPSGHAALGWAWALVLAEMAPDRADQILARGLAYGESRVVCGVHYPSDVQAGRLVGAALVSRLRADPRFQADFKLAERELTALRKK